MWPSRVFRQRCVGWFGEGKVRGGPWQLTRLGGGRGGAGDRLGAEPGTPNTVSLVLGRKAANGFQKVSGRRRELVREEDLLILKQDRRLSHGLGEMVYG